MFKNNIGMRKTKGFCNGVFFNTNMSQVFYWTYLY